MMIKDTLCPDCKKRLPNADQFRVEFPPRIAPYVGYVQIRCECGCGRRFTLIKHYGGATSSQ
jgi:RNase P subunit RPR2